VLILLQSSEASSFSRWGKRGQKRGKGQRKVEKESKKGAGETQDEVELSESVLSSNLATKKRLWGEQRAERGEAEKGRNILGKTLIEGSGRRTWKKVEKGRCFL